MPFIVPEKYYTSNPEVNITTKSPNTGLDFS